MAFDVGGEPAEVVPGQLVGAGKPGKAQFGDGGPALGGIEVGEGDGAARPAWARRTPVGKSHDLIIVPHATA